MEPARLVFETDPSSPFFTGAPLSLADFDEYDPEIDVGEDASVIAVVTRLLSRPEMMANPKAKEAVRKEAEGLVEKGTRDVSMVTERTELIAGAKKFGVRIHPGQPMSICS